MFYTILVQTQDKLLQVTVEYKTKERILKFVIVTSMCFNFPGSIFYLVSPLELSPHHY